MTDKTRSTPTGQARDMSHARKPRRTVKQVLATLRTDWDLKTAELRAENARLRNFLGVRPSSGAAIASASSALLRPRTGRTPNP